VSSLTEKQRRFAEEYVVDHNATQAAIRAGYAENNAKVQASRLLTKVNLREYVDALEAETTERVQLNAEFVLNGLMEIATGEGRDSARVRAYELLGKHLALWTDRLEVTQIPDSRTVQTWIEALRADIDASVG
jgi:phage terminase small subunit